MIRILKSLSIVSTIGMLFILLGGALVTKTDSGAGCGSSWPLCNGQLIPTDLSPELIIEYSHRLVSTIMGVTVLALSILSWKFLGHVREVKFLAVLSTFFLILQGLIGAAAVKWGQSSFVLAAHLDGKSTRLNSSHVAISYAVFCLTKKKTEPQLHYP